MDFDGIVNSNCGRPQHCERNNNNLIWILILICLCGCGNFGDFFGGDRCHKRRRDKCCNNGLFGEGSGILILLLLFCCCGSGNRGFFC